MYTNADGLVANGIELEFKEWILESACVIAAVKTELNKRGKISTVLSRGIHNSKEGKRRHGMASLIRDTLLRVGNAGMRSI